ncbi:MAG: hypothetical protein U9Q33_02085 [Campylobacterota bacterium]|nr:hypothetical protein [Campylobacterota bacterium]
MKKCNLKLKKLIEDVVLPDIEDHMDHIFEQIANNKSSNDQLNDELAQMQEMRKEFQEILTEIDENSLDNDECTELYEDIMEMIKEEE